MAAHKDPVIERWWPLPQSMQLVRAPAETVGAAMWNEFKHLKWDEKYACRINVRIESLDSVFAYVKDLKRTTYIVLPTQREWTVFWCNRGTWGVEGHLALCKFLSSNADLETIAFRSHDQTTDCLANTSLSWFAPGYDSNVHPENSRTFLCGNMGRRWHWEEHGDPLPEEDCSRYSAIPKRNRMNETALMELLARMGAFPWREEFYSLDSQPCTVIERPPIPDHFAPLTFDALCAEVQRRQAGLESKNEQDEIEGPPDYLSEYVLPPDENGPAKLLLAKWRDRARETVRIYDVQIGDDRAFHVRLPASECEYKNPPSVRVELIGTDEGVLVYDCRRHDGHALAGLNVVPSHEPRSVCPMCGDDRFHIGLGFEVPADCWGPNDLRWFYLATQCLGCERRSIVYNDEIH